MSLVEKECAEIKGCTAELAKIAIEAQRELAGLQAQFRVLGAAFLQRGAEIVRLEEKLEMGPCTVIVDTWLIAGSGAKHNWWCRTHKVGWDLTGSFNDKPECCPVGKVGS